MSTTTKDAIAALRARLDAPDSAITIPMYWHGDDPPTLPDTPAAFAYVVFNNNGSGSGPIEFGGGRGRNRYRNTATLEAYVFAPAGEGMSVALDYAEAIAARLRSFRDASVSCFSADVIPVGPGSSISPPGLQSEVSSYQCAVCEVDVVFDLVG
jgi:hypothetical protein